MSKPNHELAAFCIEYLLHKSGQFKNEEQTSLPAIGRIDAIVDVIQAYRASIQRKPVCRLDYKPALRLRRFNAN